jgi:hypothetical protein
MKIEEELKTVREAEERVFKGLAEAYSGITVAILNLKVERYCTSGEISLKETRFEAVRTAIDDTLNIFISCKEL